MIDFDAAPGGVPSPEDSEPQAGRLPDDQQPPHEADEALEEAGDEADDEPEDTGDEEREHALFIARCCAEKKARDIVIIDMSRALGMTDYFVICSAASDRQARVIAQHCDQQVKAQGSYRKPPLEGADSAQWICADFGDVVLHVFTETQRRFYDLETIWGDAPRLRFEAPELPGIEAEDEDDWD